MSKSIITHPENQGYPEGMLADQYTINVAATCGSTQSLGPGLRSVVWVQGCPFSCHGCMSPDWIPYRKARFMQPSELVDELLADPVITGITFSGGEPFTQAQGLYEVVRRARERRRVDIVCFTGYRFEQLKRMPDGFGIHEFLGEIDVLIDGPFIESRKATYGLRGSDNQRIYHLTNRLRYYDFEGISRRFEINLFENELFLVGIPPIYLTPEDILLKFANVSPSVNKEKVHEWT